MGVTACNDLEGTGDKGYVTQDGLIATVAVDERDPAITYDGEDLDGQALSLADYRGTVVVVSVWGSWCGPCRKEAPLLVGAQKELGDKAHFVGVDVRDGGTAGPRAYEEQFGIDWPSFYSPGGEALLAFPGTITPNSIPATVVLDAEGRVAASIIGALPSQLTLVEIVEQVAADG
jgi:thiol-disulfide isomerase/thioredoxin